jgi:glutamate 5-kinase
MDGEFEIEETVQLCNLHGQEIARGIVNYNCQDLEKIRGHRSDEIAEILGYSGEETVVHRDNLVLTRRGKVV